jgi:hypothetical protein
LIGLLLLSMTKAARIDNLQVFKAVAPALGVVTGDVPTFGDYRPSTWPKGKPEYTEDASTPSLMQPAPPPKQGRLSLRRANMPFSGNPRFWQLIEQIASNPYRKKRGQRALKRHFRPISRAPENIFPIGKTPF